MKSDKMKTLRQKGMRTLSALGVLLVCAGGMLGCGKEPEAPTEDRASPKSYMNDKPFLNRLKEQKASRQQLQMRHIEAMNAYQAALKDDPDCKLEATKSLKAKVVAIEKEYMASRQKTMAEVRERITPRKGGAASGAGK